MSLPIDLWRRITQMGRRSPEPSPTIEVFTSVAGLDAVHPPVPAAHALPGWFTRMSANVHGRRAYEAGSDEPHLTVRACPGIGDLLSLGVILPLWTDYAVKISEDGEELTWESPREGFSIKAHGKEQLGGLPLDGEGEHPLSVKLVNPWYVRTPPGVSCLLVQPFYRPEGPFRVLPGVVDTDVYHGCNVNTVWRKTEGTVVIEAGTPLVQIVPFVRREWELAVRAGAAADARAIALHDLRFNNSLKARPGHYRRERKGAGGGAT